MKRKVFLKGPTVSLVEQVATLDSEYFLESRQDTNDLALIGAYGNSYSFENVYNEMSQKKEPINKSPKNVWTILSNKTGEYLGDFRYVIHDGLPEIGILITKQYRCHNYGSEAINVFLKYAKKRLHLKRIWLRCYENNIRALKLYQKLGFVEKERISEEYFVNGKEYLAILCYKDL